VNEGVAGVRAVMIVGAAGVRRRCWWRPMKLMFVVEVGVDVVDGVCRRSCR